MGSTVVSTFFEQTKKLADAAALKYKRDGEWATITWTDYGDLVRRAAGGLRSLGVDAGDRAAILSANRYEWHVADIAIQSCGGITVPIYPTNSPIQVAYIAGHAEVKVIFCENAAQLEKVREVRGDLPALQKAIVFDPTAIREDDFVMTWDSLLADGDTFNAAHPTDIDQHVAAVKPDDLCTVVYTSGTTGPPKGAMLTHDNIVWTCETLSHVLEGEPGDRRLSYLPLSHIAERTTSHFQQIYLGFETWFATSIDTLREDLVACKPTVIFGVPRVWEKFYAGITNMIENLPAEQREMAEQAIQLGLKRVEAEQAGTSLPPELEEKYQEADGKLFALARGALGLDKARALVSGAAPINPDVLRFFHAIGLPIAEVYGQTEDSGPTSINRPGKIKIGTVGPALDGVEVKIATDGEVLVRGGNVGPGYYKDPIATKEFIDSDGWMHSGDIGELDEDGYLRITDRKKDLIITAAGKNIAPQVIENMLKYSPWISQVVVIGDRRPYLTALITLDQEKVTAFAEQKSIPFKDLPDLVAHPDVQQLVANAVQDVNANLARVEQIKKWHVFDRDFAMENEEVTPTLKVRRKAIMDKNADLIEELYQ
ncbi:MAG TPA: long-chain fatty acid--CoA ligase [Actinomycetota bacterium]|nr:long-chain fatty acid--CoA ligase [Actinomycetota bacterium]